MLFSVIFFFFVLAAEFGILFDLSLIQSFVNPEEQNSFRKEICHQ